MREWIELVESSTVEPIEEKLGKLGGLAAAALLGSVGNIPKQAPIAAPSQAEMQDQARKQEDLKLLALTMWGEARGDGPEAMRAVGHVIINRMKSERFGDSVKDVVWKRKAFSCWNPNDPNRQAMGNIARLPKDSVDRQRWGEALEIAKQIMSGRSTDITNGALFYHTKQISPYWVEDDAEPTAMIANHVFYDKDKKA